MFGLLFSFNDNIVSLNFFKVDFLNILLFDVNNCCFFSMNLYLFNLLYRVFESFFLWKIIYFFYSYNIHLIFLTSFLFLTSRIFYCFLRLSIYVCVHLLNCFYNFIVKVCSPRRFTDPVNTDFLSGILVIISYYRMPWILYLESEYKLIFKGEILKNWFGPVLRFILLYLYNYRYLFL